ncbi:hypothetical protein B296_00005536 [Ensete ventricosum]|uniref:Retrotransposon gag domain-containing protein n=1 Tax=Ensete ventricosum TaxID=4639 RepID=A0A427ALW8_ENSVE|nr:hypothetical protein B296_00005536 [Ensete ventricosum]
MVCHGGLSWQRFKEGLLNLFRPTDFNNIDGQLAKIRQTSIIQEYQTRFERLSNKTENWFEKQLLGKVGDPRRSKGTTTVHSYGGDLLRAYSRRTIEPRGIKDKDRSSTSHAKAYYHLYCHQSPCTKKVDKRRAHERSAKELCWHCDESWSREHHCKKGRLLVIKPAEDEDNKTSKEALEPKEEAVEEVSQLADYAVHKLAGYSNPHMMKVGGLLNKQPITILVDTGSTNKFLNSKVAAYLALQIVGCNQYRSMALKRNKTRRIVILAHARLGFHHPEPY